MWTGPRTRPRCLRPIRPRPIPGSRERNWRRPAPPPPPPGWPRWQPGSGCRWWRDWGPGAGHERPFARGSSPLRLSTPRPKRWPQPRPSQRAGRSPTPRRSRPGPRANRPTTAITTKRVLECAERMRAKAEGRPLGMDQAWRRRRFLLTSETRKAAATTSITRVINQ